MYIAQQTDRHEEVIFCMVFPFPCILTVLANKSDTDSAIPRTGDAAENTDRPTMTSLPVLP